MGNMKPQPRILTIWRIILTLTMCVPAFINSLLFRITSPVWLWGSVIWIAVFLALYTVYLPTRYSRLSFSVDDDSIRLYSGVIFYTTRSVPESAIQYVYLLAGPFQRIFGLCSLVVVMAGGRIALPGLRRQDAEALSQSLMR